MSSSLTPPPSRSSYGSDSSSSSTEISTTNFCLARINLKKLLASYFARYDKSRIDEIEVLLRKNEGKEDKLMLMLAKRYGTSNPLNAVYIKLHSRLPEDQLNDFSNLATLYFSVFRPSDLGEIASLLERYKGNEADLFSKLATNFHAVNPLKLRLKKQSIDYNQYKQALVVFFEQNDGSKVDEVDMILSKCTGKEAILFSVLAEKYQAMNGLDTLFRAQVESCNQDYLSLLQLYLSIFHPSCTSDAESMLSRWVGKEADLFDKLAQKFRSSNALRGVKRNNEMDPKSCLDRLVPQSPARMITTR